MANLADGAGVIFFTNARFRLILAPAVILLAAAALDRLPVWLRTRRSHRRALVLTAALGGCVAARSHDGEELP